MSKIDWHENVYYKGTWTLIYPGYFIYGPSLGLNKTANNPTTKLTTKLTTKPTTKSLIG